MAGIIDNKVTSPSKILQQVYDETEKAIRVLAELDASDIQIGAVEIKDKDTDERLKVHTNGSVDVNVLSGSSGTEADESSDSGTLGDGLVPLTAGPDIIVSKSHTTGTYHINAIDFSSDRVCSVKIEVRDAGTLVETIRARRNSPEEPGFQLIFPTPIEIAGVATRVIRIVATRLQGANGFASGSINGFTT